MNIVQRNRISDVVCKFSTGSEAPYYGCVEQWFYALLGGLKVNNIVMMSYCPQFPQNEGSGHLIINVHGREELYIFYSYYKMPSGRWEIICYLT